MKIGISLIVTAAGFCLGLTLAGVGGLSAGTLSIQKSKIENNRKIEAYWNDTGLGSEEVFSLISNAKCKSSQRYYQACLNSVIQNGFNFNLKISFPEGRLVKLNKSDKLPDLSERDLLNSYLNSPVNIDFENVTGRLFLLESKERKAALAAEIINAFLSVYFDPHTYIMPSKYFREVSSKIDRSKFFVGISYEKRNGEFYVRKVSKNSDADLAGLKNKDKLVAINEVTLKGLRYEDISNLLKDEESKVLNFKVLRGERAIDISVTRSFRFLSHVQYNVIKEDKNFGLLTLSKFNKGVCQEVAETLKAAKDDKIAGMVLDLRDNPGGFLDEAACITGLFLGKNKKAYYVEYLDNDKPNEVVLTSEEQLFSGPLAVLVNASSASASESLAGALQEYRRAVVVGERTFGKGTFQEPEEWLMNSKISLFKTQGYYLLPSRNTTQVVGVKPNIEIDGGGQRREASFFFKPLHKNTKKYHQLRRSEQIKDIVYSECTEPKFHVGDDLYLQKSLNVLSCAKLKAKLAVQTINSSLN